MSNRLLIRQNLSFFIQFQILMKTWTSSMTLSILNLVLFVTCESSTNKVLLLIKMILKTKPFCMNHKPTARVMTQRSSKAATHYIDKLKNLLFWVHLFGTNHNQKLSPENFFFENDSGYHTINPKHWKEEVIQKGLARTYKAALLSV